MEKDVTCEKLMLNYSNEEIDFFKNCKHLSPWIEALFADKSSETQVTTCFLQKEDKVLVLQRAKKDAQYSLWGIPGGKLNPHEHPVIGLCREIFEETGLVLDESSFTHLGSAVFNTSTDGQYGLHLYHAELSENEFRAIEINKDEHLSYQWVTLEQFKNLNLLHAQREAFLFVYKRLLNKMQRNIWGKTKIHLFSQ